MTDYFMVMVLLFLALGVFLLALLVSTLNGLRETIEHKRIPSDQKIAEQLEHFRHEFIRAMNVIIDRINELKGEHES